MKQILNVIVVTYEFYPMGGTGVQRVRSWTKHFPLYGIRPIVLTINKQNGTHLLEADPYLQVPNSIEVYRTFCLEPYTIMKRMTSRITKEKYRQITNAYSDRKRSKFTRLVDIYNEIMVPDAKLFWLPFALRTAESILLRHQVDAVLSTFPTEFIIAPDTLREIARVLRPGGRAVVVVMAQFLPDGPWTWFLEELYRITGQRDALPDLRPHVETLGLAYRTMWRTVGGASVLLAVLEKQVDG